MCGCIHMTWNTALDRVSNQLLELNWKKISTAIGPFWTLQARHINAGKSKLTHLQFQDSFQFIMVLSFHSGNQSNAEMWFDCNICRRVKIFTHIIFRAHCLATKRFHAMAKMVRNMTLNTFFSLDIWMHRRFYRVNLMNWFEIPFSGVGDTGDHWKVVCSDDVWLRSNAVKFHHVDTDVYLSVSGRTFGR